MHKLIITGEICGIFLFLLLCGRWCFRPTASDTHQALEWSNREVFCVLAHVVRLHCSRLRVPRDIQNRCLRQAVLHVYTWRYHAVKTIVLAAIRQTTYTGFHSFDFYVITLVRNSMSRWRNDASDVQPKYNEEWSSLQYFHTLVLLDLFTPTSLLNNVHLSTDTTILDLALNS